MTVQRPETSLDAIRREIDSIDDQILRLLMQRAAATQKVKASKSSDGSIASSPFRPAREAVVMRRLIAEAGDALDPDMLVRLWRVILSASIQSQASVTLHMDEALGSDLHTRLLVGQHFCGMKVEMHGTPAAVLAAVGRAHGDLAILAPGSDWAPAFSEGAAGRAQVIVTLPVIARGSQPQLLVFGHAAPQPSGDDETLIVFPDAQDKVPGASWLVRSGAVVVAGLPGFITDAASLPASGACIAGCYPCPFKVST